MPGKAIALSMLLTLSPTIAFAMGNGHHKNSPHPGEPVVRLHGHASYYGDRFQGRKTATGETFSQNKLTAASKELPLGSKAVVRNPQTGQSVTVKVNDRGPYVDDRIIDLSKTAAARIGLGQDGVAPVEIELRPSEQPTGDLKDAVAELAQLQGR